MKFQVASVLAAIIALASKRDCWFVEGHFRGASDHNKDEEPATNEGPVKVYHTQEGDEVIQTEHVNVQVHHNKDGSEVVDIESLNEHQSIQGASPNIDFRHDASSHVTVSHKYEPSNTVVATDSLCRHNPNLDYCTYFVVDCSHEDVTSSTDDANMGTASTIDATIYKNGYQLGSKIVFDDGFCKDLPFEYVCSTDCNADALRLISWGRDALFIDRVRIKRYPNNWVQSWGLNNAYGWCVSEDKLDYQNNDEWDHLVGLGQNFGNYCVDEILFSRDGLVYGWARE